MISAKKLHLKIIEKIIGYSFQLLRIAFYKVVSNISSRGANVYQPLLIDGLGKIKFGTKVKFGVIYSPFYYSGYSYINVRNVTSCVEIGDNCHFNNNATIISNGASIVFGKNCLIGHSFSVVDSDFHVLNRKNKSEELQNKDVTIGNNVFIGNNVSILKGVTIGNNSVIGSNSVVTSNIESDVIAAGNPCKFIKCL
ncbi:acyltransferase [Daejeonella oryzae]|uniref:acyltransferase n=1 Tax=Daejeonella oryzae TaxID=1122943 RepID=UPI00041B8004|nr:acyltransferase [Daejeonella oryzae]